MEIGRAQNETENFHSGNFVLICGNFLLLGGVTVGAPNKLVSAEN